MTRTVLLLLAFLWLLPSTAMGLGDWEADLTVSAGYVKTRLAIGQHGDATDQPDGRYDVPPMLAGSLQAWLLGGGASLWRDIRSPDTVQTKEWRLKIRNLSREPITIGWSPQALPDAAGMVLTDPANGVTVDMKQFNTYTLDDPAGGEVLIRLTF